MERRFEAGHATAAGAGTTTHGYGFSPDTFSFGGAGSGGGNGGGVAAAATADRAGAVTATPAALTPTPRTAPSSVFSPNTTNTTTTPTTTPSKRTTFTFHTHRQNHNSSKLPTFRFADLHKDTHFRPSLLQHELRLQDHSRTPPSPVSPGPDQHPETQPNAALEISPPPTKHHPTANSVSLDHEDEDDDDHHFGSGEFTFRFQIPSPPAAAPVLPPATATATHSANAATIRRATSLDTWSHARSRIPYTLPEITTTLRSPSDSSDTTVAARSHQRRAAASLDTSTRQYASDDPDSGREEPQGQRELLLPKTIQRTLSDDRRNSLSRKPPNSYKPPSSSHASGGTTTVPPIRSFRSSIQRRNSLFDMNIRSARPYDATEDFADFHHRDKTLRALEGRRGDDASQITPPDSAIDRPDGDDSGDVFLKIAREDPSRRAGDRENQSAVSRLARSTRRPLSVTISSRPKSPPQVSRRMSDQQERSRSRGVGNEQSGERIARSLAYKGPSREKSFDDVKSRIASTPLRGSLLTPRSLAFQDPVSEPGPAYNPKRKASVDASTPVPSRKSSLKQTSTNYSQPRAFNSSPLVPRATIESNGHDAPTNGANHGVEGTDSTGSTAAPSTVWDELDELKSRIHRLELTGKLPPTSGAAISRASDERPPTAHTNATTLSASPKRGPGGVVQSIEVPSAQKESHPLLHSALTKSKEFLSPAVFEALETAANDALALSSMMGMAGQPGPISSGASSIGGATTVTDRQLRRKADSICRSLTELCLALSEGVAQNKPQQTPTSPRLDPLVTSPTITKFAGISNSRRPSMAPERIVTLNSSPRTSRPEERRNSVMVSNALPSPRFNSNPLSPIETPTHGRKTSLLLSRTRRAGTEEPEDARSKSTMLLRTRRAQTEEPEDRTERKRPLITRGRRGTVDDREDEGRFRTPSRAVTEVQRAQHHHREYSSHLPTPPLPMAAAKESNPLDTSALPRRRLTTTTVNTRLAQPSTASTMATPTRRYFDRPVPSRESQMMASKLAEDRPQRQYSMPQTAGLNRRPTRESMIAAPSTATGNYR